MEFRHLFLTSGSSVTEAAHRVSVFLARTQLISYDKIIIEKSKNCNATSPEFWPAIVSAIAVNEEHIREYILALTDELQITTISDLAKIQRGYESKVVHILAHFLDGFIGIDSAFYNLEEDSHRLSLPLTANIKAIPSQFWLIHACGEINAGSTDQLTAIRKGILGQHTAM